MYLLTAEIDVNYTNITNEFCSNERTISTHSVLDCHHVETACAIVELAPEWSYCEVQSIRDAYII